LIRAVRARLAWLALAAAVVAGCRHSPSPEPLRPLERRERFTCCNFHYSSEAINDANYWTGTKLPAGTPVRIEHLTNDSVTFSTGEVTLTLTHKYGTKGESFQQYLDKVLVTADPRPRIAGYPRAVRRAIDNAKVERGMTRDQVLLSLGYPPMDRTASVQDREWTYWWNRSFPYKVVFDDAGKVADVTGRPAPTAEVPIANADRPPPAKASKKHKGQ
jgi:SmpA / OmlA family